MLQNLKSEIYILDIQPSMVPNLAIARLDRRARIQFGRVHFGVFSTSCFPLQCSNGGPKQTFLRKWRFLVPNWHSWHSFKRCSFSFTATFRYWWGVPSSQLTSLIQLEKCSFFRYWPFRCLDCVIILTLENNLFVMMSVHTAQDLFFGTNNTIRACPYIT